MKPLEDFLLPTQEALFQKLQKWFEKKAVKEKGRFLLVPGESPVLLIAHLDTVHRVPVKTICSSKCGNILMSPQGIGGDDRCGVYGIVKVYEASEQKPWLLFTCDEEIGGRGADAFCTAYQKQELPEGLNELKMLIELDRRGKNDAVYYSCTNPKFEEYITGKGFRTEFGTFSDISCLAPALGVAAVNFSCGYYNAHTLHEFINRKHLNATVRKVIEMVSEAVEPNFPKYEFMRAQNDPCIIHDYWYDPYADWYGSKVDIPVGSIPKDLPSEFEGIYEELLEVYEPGELEYYRMECGDQILLELYEDEFGERAARRWTNASEKIHLPQRQDNPNPEMSEPMPADRTVHVPSDASGNRQVG